MWQRPQVADEEAETGNIKDDKARPLWSLGVTRGLKAMYNATKHVSKDARREVGAERRVRAEGLRTWGSGHSVNLQRTAGRRRRLRR